MLNEKIKTKDGKELILRELVAADFDPVADYLAQLATETIFTNQYVGRKMDKEKSLRLYADENNLFLGVFEPSGKVVGSCTITIAKPDHIWCNKNAVFGISMLKDYYGQGIGSVMMEKMIDWAYQKGMHLIEGRVRAKNRRAISLYLKYGFEICGLIKETALINNEWHDEYIICKRL